MKILGLITARGGSKTIPGKNIKMLAGRPMIAWTIEAARGASSLDRVVVSTDDEAITQVCRRWGADVPFLRPAELAGDASPHVDVLLHALAWLAEHQDYRPDYLLLLQPTSPLRTSLDIDRAAAQAQALDADAVIGVTEAPSHPYLVKRMDEAGRLCEFVPTPNGYLRRQDLPSAWAVNGAIYLVKTEILLEKKTWYTDRTFAYVMPEERSLDVDTPFDFHLAELVLEAAATDDRANPAAALETVSLEGEIWLSG